MINYGILWYIMINDVDGANKRIDYDKWCRWSEWYRLLMVILKMMITTTKTTTTKRVRTTTKTRKTVMTNLDILR